MFREREREREREQASERMRIYAGLRVINFMLFMSTNKIVKNLRVIVLDKKNCDCINSREKSIRDISNSSSQGYIIDTKNAFILV